MRSLNVNWDYLDAEINGAEIPIPTKKIRKKNISRSASREIF